MAVLGNDYRKRKEITVTHTDCKRNSSSSAVSNQTEMQISSLLMKQERVPSLKAPKKWWPCLPDTPLPESSPPTTLSTSSLLHTETWLKCPRNANTHTRTSKVHDKLKAFQGMAQCCTSDLARIT